MKNIQNILCYSTIFIELMSFNAAIADWSDPINIITATYANSPLVGVDNLGNAVIISETSPNNTTFNIHSAQLIQGVLTNPHVLTNTGIVHEQKALSVNGSGNAAVDWIVQGSNVTLYSSLLLNNQWSGPTAISSIIVDDSVVTDFPPGISLDKYNVAKAVWESQLISTHNIQTNQYTTDWGTPTDIFSTDSFLGSFAYKGSPYGRGIAAWVDIGENPNRLLAAYYNGLTWSVSTIATNVMSACFTGTDVSINLSDNAMILWVNSSGGLSSLSYINGNPGSEQVVYSQISGEVINNDDYRALIALDDSGNAFAIFSTTLAGINYVKISHYVNGVWQAPFILDQTSSITGSFSYLNVGVDHLGDAFAVWEKDTSGIGAVYYNQYTAATNSWKGASNAPIPLSHSSFSITQPNLSVNANEGATVVWTLNNTESSNQTVQAVYLSNQIPPQVTTFSGSQVKNKYLTQTNLVNVLTWTAPISPLIANFYLFRDGVKIATIPATGPFTYEDSNRKPNVIYTYQLTTVSAQGIQSSPISVNVQ